MEGPRPKIGITPYPCKFFWLKISITFRNASCGNERSVFKPSWEIISASSVLIFKTLVLIPSNESSIMGIAAKNLMTCFSQSIHKPQ